ncbi:MAG: primosomal protein N' [Hyphomicrobiales bacterium]|nr:primosomal protein N' [Hyphomicrobiales bacterium]
MNRSTDPIVSVLLPLAIPAPYSYAKRDIADLVPGDVVEVPLGPRLVMGVVWDESVSGEPVPAGKLRAVERLLSQRRIPTEMRRFVDWVAAYTLSPPGMVLRMVLRSELALADPKPRSGIRYAGAKPQRMTLARQRVFAVLEDGLARTKRDLVETAAVSPSVVDGLVDQGVLESVPLPPAAPFADLNPDYDAPMLTKAQATAAQALRAAVKADAFSVTVIDGVTGAGKTEVYFEAVAEALRQGRQSLILLPEIALTAQFLDRFEARFGAEPAQWHSQLTSSQRETTWRAVHRGEARVVVGARSALFLPFAELGLIVIDEEHDPAYKQEDRVTYNARDMGVVRGHIGGFAVVLSSATPSIETRVNADSGRYRRVVLPARYGARAMPGIALIDMKADPPEKNRFLSPVLVGEAQSAVAAGGQALLFLNRRGYAPLTLCRACGHRFMCPDCSAWLVEHRFRGRLACHHCGFTVAAPKACPACGAVDALVACGPGVERVAEEARELFPEARLTILSSDLVSGLADMRQRFADIAQGQYDIVVGTQLIAKGHHFPLLTLVGVVDGDLGLGQGDMRAAERTYQLLHQVVGRAGRGETPGRGMIQTYLPEHPVMQALASGEEEAFYKAEIAARERHRLPPFGRLAALIASGHDKERVTAFARRLARLAPAARGVEVLGPAEAPLALVRGRHRWRLLVKAARTVDLQAYLRTWLAAAGEPKGGVRLAVDIDPYSFL